MPRKDPGRPGAFEFHEAGFLPIGLVSDPFVRSSPSVSVAQTLSSKSAKRSDNVVDTMPSVKEMAKAHQKAMAAVHPEGAAGINDRDMKAEAKKKKEIKTSIKTGKKQAKKSPHSTPKSASAQGCACVVM